MRVIGREEKWCRGCVLNVCWPPSTQTPIRTEFADPALRRRLTVYYYEIGFYYREIMAGLSDTISEGLGRYSIGEKLRTLRLRKSMGLVELGKHTGLSAALLSKLERGKLFPTLPTLL